MKGLLFIVTVLLAAFVGAAIEPALSIAIPSMAKQALLDRLTHSVIIGASLGLMVQSSNLRLKIHTLLQAVLSGVPAGGFLYLMFSLPGGLSTNFNITGLCIFFLFGSVASLLQNIVWRAAPVEQG